MGDNRRTFRFEEEYNQRLAEIAEYYFGSAKGNDTTTLKFLINKEYKIIQKDKNKNKNVLTMS